jgi:hypothetical protein
MDRPLDTPRSGRLVLVLSTPSIPGGLVARGLLEEHDIPVMTKGESEGPYRMGPVHLYVPEEYETQARLILAEATLGTGD